MKASRRAFLRCASAAFERTVGPTHTPDRLRCAQTEGEPAFLVLQHVVREGGEEKGTPLVAPAQEGAQAGRGHGDSSALLEENEPTAHTPTHRIGCSHEPRVPDTTER